MEKLTQEQLEQVDVIVGKGNGYILMTFKDRNIIFNCNRVNFQNIMSGQCILKKIIEDDSQENIRWHKRNNRKIICQTSKEII